MALIVEDGSIVANADSYVSEADFTAYAASLGWTVNAGTQEADLRRAAMYLDRQYQWVGWRVDIAQTMQWPRHVDVLIDGFSVASDSIPDAIKKAQMEIAYLFNQGEDLFAYASGAPVKRKREKVEGIEEETEYFASSSVQARILSVEGLLRDYVVGGQPGATMKTVPFLRN